MTADVSRPSSLPRSKERFSDGTRGNANAHQTNVLSHAKTSSHPNKDSDGLGSDNENDSNVPPRIRASRNSKSQKDPLPSQLCFYEGHWIHILNSAKTLFRYVIHTDIPFLERSDKNLKIAQECILEALCKYIAENEDADIDKCQFLLSPPCSTLANIVTAVYEANKVGMTMLVSPLI